MDKTLEQQLLCLAHYVRDPAGSVPPQGMEPRRLAIYRRLFYGNIEAMLASGFPVLCASLGSAGWHRLVQDVYAHYRCQTPLFTELASEFVLYLDQGVADRRPRRASRQARRLLHLRDRPRKHPRHPRR